MPVNNQGGGGWSNGGGRGPWGQGPQGVPPSGGGGGQSPDLEDLIRQGRDRFKSVLPGGRGGPSAGGIFALIALAVVIWGLTGLYQVGPNQVGVVTQFGAYTRSDPPGLNYHIPWPVENAQTLNITDERSVDIGFERLGRGDRTRSIPQESLMLTGDENIIDINFSVLWIISDAPKYLFNVQFQENTVKAVAESAMREVVGRRKLEAILTQERDAVQSEVQQIMQATLDGYGEGAGIQINNVQLRHVGPPNAVVKAFQDVQTAEQDQEKFREDARKYAGKIVPEARGEAQRILRAAEAYKSQIVSQAQGDASRFLAILSEYKRAPKVTRERIYFETMERVMGKMDKVIIDTPNAGQGVVPYLPLPSLEKRRSTVSTQSQGPSGISSQKNGGQ